MPKFSVIVPAAGKSERFGGSEKKTFAKLDGRPIFLRTLEHFIRRDDVCQTILVVAPEDVDTMRSTYGPNLGLLGVKLVEGGAQRFDSVRAALEVVAEDADFVAIHDAARPCITSDMIDKVFSEAAKTGAAILAVPITDTIKKAGPSMVVDQTVSREGLFEAQTPQVFRKDILLDAYNRLDTSGQDVTDDAQLVELTGHPIALVQSDRTSLKVTTKADIALANAICKARPVKRVQRLGAFEEAQW